MQEWKDTKTKQTFVEYKEYIEWIMSNNFVGFRECLVTTYSGKDKKQIIEMATALTDCSGVQLIKGLMQKAFEEVMDEVIEEVKSEE